MPPSKRRRTLWLIAGLLVVSWAVAIFAVPRGSFGPSSEHYREHAARRTIRGEAARDAERAEAQSAEFAEAYAYLMTAFLRALREAPLTNKEPARDWTPLLRDPGLRQPLCSTCHAEPNIRALDRLADAPALPRPALLVDDHDFMVELMQRWVSKLNRNAGKYLDSAVSCVDCHERDPRRR